MAYNQDVIVAFLLYANVLRNEAFNSYGYYYPKTLFHTQVVISEITLGLDYHAH